MRAESGPTHEIKRKFDLRKGVLPCLHGEARVYTAEGRDQMVFESSDIAFGLVRLMVVGRDQLLNDPRELRVTKSANGRGVLVILTLEVRNDAVSLEPRMATTVGGHMTGCLTVGQHLNVDVVQA